MTALVTVLNGGEIVQRSARRIGLDVGFPVCMDSRIHRHTWRPTAIIVEVVVHLEAGR
jgi:hypothetical protein